MCNNLCIQMFLARSINEPGKQASEVTMLSAISRNIRIRQAEHAEYVGKSRVRQEPQVHTLGTCGCEILTLQVVFFVHSHLYLNMEYTTCNIQSFHWNLRNEQNLSLSNTMQRLKDNWNCEQTCRLPLTCSHLRTAKCHLRNCSEHHRYRTQDATSCFEKFFNIGCWIGLLGVMLASTVCHFTPSIEVCSRITITRQLPFAYMWKLPQSVHLKIEYLLQLHTTHQSKEERAHVGPRGGHGRPFISPCPSVFVLLLESVRPFSCFFSM